MKVITGEWLLKTSKEIIENPENTYRFHELLADRINKYLEEKE